MQLDLAGSHTVEKLGGFGVAGVSVLAESADGGLGGCASGTPISIRCVNVYIINVDIRLSLSGRPAETGRIVRAARLTLYRSIPHGQRRRIADKELANRLVVRRQTDRVWRVNKLAEGRAAA